MSLRHPVRNLSVSQRSRGILPRLYQTLIFFMSHTKSAVSTQRKELWNLTVSQKKRGIIPSPYQSLIFFMYVHEEKRYGTYQSLRGKEGFPPVLIGLFLVCIRFSYFVKCFFLRLKVFLIIFFCSLRQSRYRSLPRVYLFLLVHDILIERNPPPRGFPIYYVSSSKRGPPSKSKHTVQTLRGGSSYTRFLMREHSK